MTLNDFRNKLLLLVQNKDLTSEEIKYISIFENDEELFESTRFLSNETAQINNINKITKEILFYKKDACSLWKKILNCRYQN